MSSLKDFFWSFSQSIFSKFISLLAFVLIAREISPEEFGLIAFAMIFMQISLVFVEAGFSQALVRQKEITERHSSSVFWINIIIGSLATSCLFVGAPAISVFFGQENLVEPLRVISCSIVINSMAAVQLALLQRDLRFKYIALRNVIATFISSSAGVYFAIYGYGVWALVFQNLIQSLVGLFMIWRVSSWRPTWTFDIHSCKELFVFGRGVLGMGLLGQLSRRSDDLLIGAFLGAAALGAYSIAFRIFTLLDDVMNGSIKRVIFPQYAKLSLEPENLNKTYHSWSKISFSILSPVCMIIAITSEAFIPAVFGSSWQVSVPICQCLMLVLIALSLNVHNDMAILALGESGLLFRVNLVLTVLMVLLFFLVVNYGVVAVAVVFVIRNFLFGLPIMFFIVRKKLNLRLSYFFKSIAPEVFSLVLMSLSGAFFADFFYSLSLGVFLEIFIHAISMAFLYLTFVLLFDGRFLKSSLMNFF